MKVLIFLTVFFLHDSHGFNMIPSYIKTCSRSDPNFNDCALKNGRAALPFILEGDPIYHIPSFKPFKVNLVSLEASENIKLYANDVALSGFENIDLKEFNWDFENKFVTVRAFLPILNIVGTYSMNGRILIINLKGSGPMNNTHYDNDFKSRIDYSFETKNNKEYIHVDKFDISVKFLKGVHFAFGNLLNNAELSIDITLIASDQMNAFLNENWEILIDDIYPSIKKIARDVVMSILNKLASKIPFENIVTP